MSNSQPTHSEDTLITQHQVQLAPSPFRSGSFGKIFHAVWLGSHVVVKSVDFKTPEVRSTFLKEAAIWNHLQHPHIVPLFGTYISPREQTNQQGFFVCEEEGNGSLRDYLFNETQAGRIPALWRVLCDAAQGLHFLHRRGIVHADLKGNNILVDKAGVAKLTDFGLSFMPGRDVSPGSPREAVGAFQWKAPELFGTNCSQPTFESDVYALGICIVEALRGGSPWGSYPTLQCGITC